MPALSPRVREWLLRAVSVIVFIVGFSAANSRRGGVDYPVLHAMAAGIAEGTNVYELNDPGEVGQGVVGMVYPPATGFAVLPLAFFPFPIARGLFFVILNATLVLGVRAAVRRLSPNSPARVWILAAGLVLASSSIRWGTMLLQVAPLILGLLCFFVIALHTGRPRVAIAIATLATAFKITLALPFLGLLALHRRYAGFAIAVGTWMTLNALGFWRMGEDAFPTYRANVAQFEVDDGSWNINGPDPWLGASLPRLDWVFLFYGLSHHMAFSRIANLALSGLTALWLLREGLRAPYPPKLSTTYLFLTPLICLGSLAVYHHQYDACLFLAPILFAWFLPPRFRQPRWAAYLMVPLIVVVTLLPIGKAQDILGQLMGPFGVGLVKISFPIVIALALIGALVLLRKHLGARDEEDSAAIARSAPTPTEMRDPALAGPAATYSGRAGAARSDGSGPGPSSARRNETS